LLSPLTEQLKKVVKVSGHCGWKNGTAELAEKALAEDKADMVP
jgi:hypothetical protein